MDRVIKKHTLSALADTTRLFYGLALFYTVKKKNVQTKSTKHTCLHFAIICSFLL